MRFHIMKIAKRQLILNADSFQILFQRTINPRIGTITNTYCTKVQYLTGIPRKLSDIISIL